MPTKTQDCEWYGLVYYWYVWVLRFPVQSRPFAHHLIPQPRQIWHVGASHLTFNILECDTRSNNVDDTNNNNYELFCGLSQETLLLAVVRSMFAVSFSCSASARLLRNTVQLYVCPTVVAT